MNDLPAANCEHERFTAIYLCRLTGRFVGCRCSICGGFLDEWWERMCWHRRAWRAVRRFVRRRRNQ